MLETLRTKLGHLRDLAAPILISIVSFHIVIGVERINPLEIAWLTRTGWLDGWGAYLGWAHYRFVDLSSPIGALSNYGVGQSNSIVYTDSVPLFAIPFRAFSSFLPDTFQYFGIWLLLCFMLQGIAAWRLLQQIGMRNFFTLSSATIIFIFSPIMLNRVNMHMSQIAHFLFLFGLLLTLKGNFFKNFGHWFALLITSLLIHPYHFVMIFLLALTNALRDLSKSRVYSWNKILSFAWAPVIIVLTMWQVGYFQNLDAALNPWRNDLFKMDILQPLNATGKSWIISSRFPDLIGNQEGFNYLGLGPLIALFFLMLTSRSVFVKLKTIIRNHLSLFILCVLLTLYSLSNQITFARRTIITLPLPESVLELMSSFRASGRFFVIPYYASIVLIFYLLMKQNKIKMQLIVFGFASLAHIVDSSYFWKDLKLINEPRGELSITEFDSTKWAPILANSNRLLVDYAPEEVEGFKVIMCPMWPEFGELSSEFRLKTNCQYSARIDVDQTFGEISEIRGKLLAGEPEEGSVYVFDGNYSFDSRKKIVAAGWKWTFLEGKWLFHDETLNDFNTIWP